MTRTWDLLPRLIRPALYSQTDVYPSRSRFVWFLTTVPDHCATKQVFSIPLFGVHREKRQQASGTPPLVILYGRGVIRFLGSAPARLLAATTSRTTTSSPTSATSSSTTWATTSTPAVLLPLHHFPCLSSMGEPVSSAGVASTCGRPHCDDHIYRFGGTNDW